MSWLHDLHAVTAAQATNENVSNLCWHVHLEGMAQLPDLSFQALDLVCGKHLPLFFQLGLHAAYNSIRGIQETCQASRCKVPCGIRCDDDDAAL